MSYRPGLSSLAVIVIVVGLIFVVSGLRYVPGFDGVYSAPICGPLTDDQGNKIGDAGPCPSHTPFPPRSETHWDWAPFWVATN